MNVIHVLYHILYRRRTLPREVVTGREEAGQWNELEQLDVGFRIHTMIYILHYLKDPKLWELWYFLMMVNARCMSSTVLLISSSNFGVVSILFRDVCFCSALELGFVGLGCRTRAP